MNPKIKRHPKKSKPIFSEMLELKKRKEGRKEIGLISQHRDQTYHRVSLALYGTMQFKCINTQLRQWMV